VTGGFYVEGRREKLDISGILAEVAEVRFQTDKLAGVAPLTGSTIANWQTAEAGVVSVGAADTRYKLHSLLISIHNLVGSVITIRLYMRVREEERKVYEQVFDTAADPPGIWVVNGTIGLHEVLRVTIQSNDAADNDKSVDYDYMLEAM
jgi:hypothetical protein